MQKAELLRQLYADSPEPAFGFDRDLRILWVNPACSLRFPALCADAFLLKQFPDFQLEHVTKIVSGPAPKFFRSRTDKTAALLVACFSSEDDPLFTGVYQDACLPADDLPDPQGTALLSYCIRKKVFGICNQLDDLACRAEENGNDEALDSIARVEEQCLGLVRLSSNFNLYYRQDASLLESIPVEEMLSSLCRRMELQLIPLNLHFDYAVNCGSAVCRVDWTRLQAGILNIAASSAQYAHSFGKKDAVLLFRCCRAGEFLRFLLEDDVSLFSDLFTDENSALQLDESGQPLPSKRIGYRILERAVQEAGGICFLDDRSPGIRIRFQIPVSDGLPAFDLHDAPAYYSDASPNNRTDPVRIMLSDLF